MHGRADGRSGGSHRHVHRRERTEGRRPAPQPPRTAAVTYKLLYGGASAREERWHDKSCGILGVYGSNEAEVVAVAEALGTLEQEVRAYVQSRKADDGSSRLLVFLFSDSDYCLGILDKMLVAIRKQGPFTERDSTVDHLKANLRKLGEYLRSTDLQIRLEFHCIKSHSDIVGNDRADRLASEAYTTAKLYFSGRRLPTTTGTKHEIADMNEMSRALKVGRPHDSAAASLPGASSASTGSNSSDSSHTVSDDSIVLKDYIESAIEASKEEMEPWRTSHGSKASESTQPEDKPRISEPVEQTTPAPLSGVYQTVADLKREFQKQRDEERQTSENMASKLLEAVEELKRSSHVATSLVDGEEVADSKPKPEKQRKRDLLAVGIRRAGQRLRGFSRKSSTAT
ncbi:hypothetical protein PG988_006170 [Apiospora saccharicola]